MHHRSIAVTALALLLGACHSEEARKKIENLEAEAAAEAGVPPKPKPTAYLAEDKNDLLDFTYGWSAEAAAVPELAERFKTAMAEWKETLLDGAREEQALRAKSGMNFNGFTGSTVWTTAGQSGRLLSLVGGIESYTGGAHGSHGTKGILWDRSEKRDLQTADLFESASSRDSLLKDRWCKRLNQQREKKRGEPVGTGGLFDDCPGLDQISIVPSDKDGDGRFERLSLIADPYVAGAWAEGDYEVELAVTDAFIAALKPDYRASFEAQPQ